MFCNIQQHFLVLLRLYIILFNGIEYFFKSLPESAVADNCNQHIYARPFSFGNNRLNQGKYLNLYDCFSTHACLLRLKKNHRDNLVPTTLGFTSYGRK